MKKKITYEEYEKFLDLNPKIAPLRMELDHLKKMLASGITTIEIVTGNGTEQLYKSSGNNDKIFDLATQKLQKKIENTEQQIENFLNE